MSFSCPCDKCSGAAAPGDGPETVIIDCPACGHAFDFYHQGELIDCPDCGSSLSLHYYPERIEVYEVDD